MQAGQVRSVANNESETPQQAIQLTEHKRIVLLDNTSSTIASLTINCSSHNILNINTKHRMRATKVITRHSLHDDWRSFLSYCDYLNIFLMSKSRSCPAKYKTESKLIFQAERFPVFSRLLTILLLHGALGEEFVFPFLVLFLFLNFLHIVADYDVQH